VDRSAASSSARACSVRATNRRETADREVPVAAALDLATDRFQPSRIAARGQLGEHAVQRELAQQVGGGERLVGRHGQLAGAVSGADSGPADTHAAAAEGYLAGVGAVPHGRAVGVVAALGADQPGDVLGHQRLQHLQARAHRQREQALPGGTGKLGNRERHLLRQLELGVVGGGGAVGILRHGGPLLVECLGGCPTPTTRQVSGGDRHFKFYGDRDNLAYRHAQ